MKGNHVPVLKDLVLVGGGHAHVTVLKKFAMKPVPGVRLTLICRDLQAPYSGMLPGYIAGHYTFEEAHIDLVPLCRFAGARFFHDEVTGVDTENKRLICRGRPDVSYDVLSINVGSAPDISAVPGAAANVTPVKPIDGFVDNWQNLCERIIPRQGGARIGIVGAGAGGVELTLAVQYRLKQLLAGKWPDDASPEFHLITDTDDVLVTHNRFVRAKFRRVLAERNINVHTGHKVTEVRTGALQCANGATFELDEILWVTMARAQAWPAEAGLEVDQQGFIKVNDTLESVSHPGIFAAGDIAHMINHPRPKSGVFAVRQGPPLSLNVRNRLLDRPLKPYFPQKEFLSLISTGDKYAIASRSWWALEGRWVWRWKDWIDLRFMRKYNRLPEMKEEVREDIPRGLADKDASREISAVAMRCGGCGAKVGATVLENALAGLEPVSRDDVLIGLHEPDDAAVASVPAGKVMVHTVDSFRSFIDDPYIFGQVAANHALSDLYAMGAEPQTALAIVTVPYAGEKKVEDLLAQMLQGALKVLNETGTALVGGHTSEGEELSLGFSVNGLIDRENILHKGGLVPGDRLVLTKAVGTGTLFAADMQHKAKGPWIAAALESMVQSNLGAARCLFRHGATACTDVTGFGLLGHLVEMIKPSRVDVEVDLNAIPYLAGAEETVAAGVFSSLQPQNLRLRRAIHDAENASKDLRYPLLFDPQTSGGLLAGVPAEQADACVVELRKLGYTRTAIIGRALPESDRVEPVRLLL
ncbi:MAG: selenide, water dikinase SelD [Gammaproteobacteria bacterium]|nr:selenide, water dikinase SelD [Gammaproteobacteria bacterium]MDE0511086.1 selenide, water dikinase SelD [Gammaproteobacteria bacterium]